MTPHLIGVSGKIGSGKNYFAESISKILVSNGYKIEEASFATPLKVEASEIIHDFLPLLSETGDIVNQKLIKLSEIYNMEPYQMVELYSFISDELALSNKLDGYSRSEGTRRFLQYLGTDIRRTKQENYWVERFSNFVPKNCDFVFVTDVRFPNEADCVLSDNGTLVRVDVPANVIRERVIGRDGLLYSEEALTHPSEIALDDYANFDFIVGESFDPQEITYRILNKAFKNAE